MNTSRRAALARLLMLGLGAAPLLMPARPGRAQTSRLPEIALYEGADRQQRLLEGAKQEHEVSVYSALPPEDTSVLAEAFEQKYGIKVRIWRSSSETLLQRMLTEAR